MTDGQQLLVIDDDDDIRGMLELVLVSEGYKVTTASNGAAALALLDHLKPSAIVLDMKMPIMDGWAFLEHYRQRDEKKAPVIVLTAAQDDRQRAADVGADAYVAKPFAINDLLHALKQCDRIVEA